MTLRRRLYGTSVEPNGAPAPGDAMLAADAATPPDGGAARPMVGRASDDDTVALETALEDVWHAPDQLHDAVWEALDEGWHPTLLLEAAERLRDIDPLGERSCATYAAVLMRAGQAERAERLLHNFVELHGPTPTVLLFLARAYEGQGKRGHLDRTLWQAVELAPNDESVLDAWCRVHQASGGPPALHAALERAADILEAWRARLRLAALELDGGDPDEALRILERLIDTVEDSDAEEAKGAVSELLERAEQVRQHKAA